MADSSQKFIARNRAPRVQIEYDVELYGAEKKVQLPFVMGVLSDLSGKSNAETPSVSDRKFLEIDVDNFDDRMKAMAPRVEFAVPNTLTGEGNLSVDLTFEKMDDFNPAQIAAKIEPLQKLLDARTQLATLMAYMDGKAGAEALIEKILADPALLATLASSQVDQQDTQTTLDALREMAPEEAPDDRSVADALASLPDAEIEEPTEDTSDVLSNLSAAAPQDAPEDRSVDDALASLPEAVETDDPQDEFADVLSDLAESAPDDAQQDRSVEDALSSVPEVTHEDVEDDTTGVLSDLADRAPEEVTERDALEDALSSLPEVEDTSAADHSDVLSNLADAAPEDEALDTSLDDLLGDLADMAPNEDASDESSAAEALASLPDAAEAEDADDSDDILSDLADAVPDDDPEDTSLDDLLGDLADMAPDEDTSDESSAAEALASLPDVAEFDDEDSDLDDLLADLAEAPSEQVDASDDTDDVLASLPDIDEDEDADSLDDVLGDLADAAPDEDAEDDDDLDALLNDLAETATEPDSSDDIDLDDLLGDLSADDTERDGEAQEPDLDDLDLDSLLAEDETETEESSEVDLDDLDLDDLLGDLDDVSESEEQGDADLDDLLSGDDELDDASVSQEVKTDGEPVLAFGRMSADRPEPEQLKRSRFRIAIFGDFSGRATRGQMETGDALASRAPILLDADTVEDVISSFATNLVLPIGKDGAGIDVKLTELDDLHPDELYEKVALFEGLSGLKGQLGAGATAEHAAKQLTAWGEEFGQAVVPPRKTSGGNTVRADLKLSDFQKLIGDTSGELAQPSPVDDLLKRVVGPHIRKLPSPDVAAMKTAVDEALSTAMRMVLHHPEFQSIEAQWRSLDLIARSVEDDDTLDVILYDVSAEEIAADLASEEDLAQTGLVRLLTEEPLDEENGRGGYSALIGLYTFEETPPHAELLGRIGRVAAHVDAPFISAITPAYLDIKKEDRHPLVVKAWDTFRAMPEAGHVGLASPRFMLRRPYGAKSEPIYEFAFEEFTEAEGLRGMLWANPAVLVTILLAQSFKQNGKAMNLGSVMSLGGVPYHFVNDRYGDQVALPCTERNLTMDKHEHSVQRGYMPVLSVKGRDEIRLGSFNSVAGQELLGPWSGVPAPAPSPDVPDEPEVDEIEMVESRPEDDFDLDDLGLEDDTGSDDSDDLDDFLASFDDDAEEDEDDDEMDPELAALLADL
jgi:type VI secretion system ImpB/VipA family protein